MYLFRRFLFKYLVNMAETAHRRTCHTRARLRAETASIKAALLIKLMEIMAENTEVQAKCLLPLLQKTAYTTKHPKRMKSVEEKKAPREEFDRLRGKTRVNIGMPFQRWRDLRNLMRLKTDAELSLLLLDRS